MGKTKAPEGKTDTWQSANRKILELVSAKSCKFFCSHQTQVSVFQKLVYLVGGVIRHLLLIVLS